MNWLRKWLCPKRDEPLIKETVFAMAKGGDTVFVEYPRVLHPEQREDMAVRLKDLKDEWGVIVVVLEDGMRVARIECNPTNPPKRK